MTDGALPPTEREVNALQAAAELRYFVETVENMPLPKHITDEATRLLDRLYPDRVRT